MKALAELLVRFLELIEEEGRTLRDRIVRLSLGVALFFIAGALAISGLLLIVDGALLFLTPLIGNVGAHLALGTACLLTAGLVLSRGKKLQKTDDGNEKNAAL